MLALVLEMIQIGVAVEARFVNNSKALKIVEQVLYNGVLLAAL
jgi:hypothetical protein